MIWMKYSIYADLDTKALNPLSTAIPPMASAYTGQSWSFEFLAYEPRHPIIKDGLLQMTSRVLGLVAALKENASKACEPKMQRSCAVGHRRHASGRIAA